MGLPDSFLRSIFPCVVSIDVTEWRTFSLYLLPFHKSRRLKSCPVLVCEFRYYKVLIVASNRYKSNFMPNVLIHPPLVVFKACSDGSLFRWCDFPANIIFQAFPLFGVCVSSWAQAWLILFQWSEIPENQITRALAGEMICIITCCCCCWSAAVLMMTATKIIMFASFQSYSDIKCDLISVPSFSLNCEPQSTCQCPIWIFLSHSMRNIKIFNQMNYGYVSRTFWISWTF